MSNYFTQSFDLTIILSNNKIDFIESFLFFKKQISSILALSNLTKLLLTYKNYFNCTLKFCNIFNYIAFFYIYCYITRNRYVISWSNL